MGGMIAFQMAVDHPETVRSLVIVNSGPAMILQKMRQRALIQLRFAVVRLFGMRALGRMIARPLFPNPEQEELRLSFISRIAENDPRAYLNSLTRDHRLERGGTHPRNPLPCTGGGVRPGLHSSGMEAGIRRAT